MRGAHPVDGKRERPEAGAHRARRLELEPVGETASAEVQRAAAGRAELDVDGMSMARPAPPSMWRPRRLDHASRRSKSRAQAVRREKRREEAVGVGEVEHDPAVGDRGGGDELTGCLGRRRLPVKLRSDSSRERLAFNADSCG